MKNILFCFLFLISALLPEDLQTFRMEDGTKIIGTILSENDSVFEIETYLGIVQIEKKDIKKSKWKFYMNDGTILVGNKITDSDTEVIIDADIGIFKIQKDDYFLTMPILNDRIYLAIMFAIAIFI
jgi:hypothetical protein